jgi:hypothetical protein
MPGSVQDLDASRYPAVFADHNLLPDSKTTAVGYSSVIANYELRVSGICCCKANGTFSFYGDIVTDQNLPFTLYPVEELSRVQAFSIPSAVGFEEWFSDENPLALPEHASEKNK